MSAEAESRKILEAAIQEALHSEDAEEAQGNVVTGWVVIAESMGMDGNRWLSRQDGGPAGRLPEWVSQGLLFNALHSGGWSDDEDES